MTEHLHDRAAELIPELREWNDGDGISLAAWAYAMGRYDYAIAYAPIFWPDFVLHDDCVFRLDPGAENYATWLSSLHGDRSKVEGVINHLHILDMFTSEGFEPTAPVVVHIARVLKDMWSCKLQRDFPERQFKVEIHEGSPGDLGTYEITFFQDPSGPRLINAAIAFHCLGCGTHVPARMREQAARDKPVALAIWLSEYASSRGTISRKKPRGIAIGG